MRLKSSSTSIMDAGPRSLYNGNHTSSIVNSPKRINTVQNSNYTSSTTTNGTANITNTTTDTTDNSITLTSVTGDSIHDRVYHNLLTSAIVDTLTGGLHLLTEDTVIVDNDNDATALLNNINNISNQVIGVPWCKSLAREQQQRQQKLTNNTNTNTNINQPRPITLHSNNINNRRVSGTLAAQVAASLQLGSSGGETGPGTGAGTQQRCCPGTGTSLCSSAGSSPDDSVLDFEDAPHSSSSVEHSPAEEDRVFDISSDTDSLSEEGNNICDKIVPQEEPHHLHHRGIINPNYPGFQHLAHTLDFRIKTGTSDTEDEECDPTQDNNANNNNNNNVEEVLDKIDSVNRLDSVENIQKVFYDKPVLNIPAEDLSVASSSGASNCGEDSDSSDKKIDFNITCEKLVDSADVSGPCVNIIGDFEKEIEREFGRISRDHSHFTSCDDAAQLEVSQEEVDGAAVARAIQLELQEAVERLSIENDLTPSASKYNIEPNVEQPFNKVAAMEAAPVMVEEVAISKEQFNAECRELKLLAYQVPDAYLSGVEESELKNIDQALYLNINVEKLPIIQKDKEEPMEIHDNLIKPSIDDVDSNKMSDFIITTSDKVPVNANVDVIDDIEKFCKEEKTKDDLEKDEDSAVVPRKKEKIDLGCIKKRRELYQPLSGTGGTVQRREFPGKNRDCLNRRSMPIGREHKRRNAQESMGSFDVYNIETAMPKIDMEAIESHLRAAREEERRRRTDREEIRRRLAMGNEDDYYGACDRPGRKPSLQARLQSGMNLQICFMNETASDTDSPSSDSEHSPIGQQQLGKKHSSSITAAKHSPGRLSNSSTISSGSTRSAQRPVTLALGGGGGAQQQPQSLPHSLLQSSGGNEMDFFAKQARLQTEARMALAQAKEMARMQMEIEKQRQKQSPITEMVRHSLEKVGIPFPEDRRRLSRQILTEMNVAQLQVIVNDLHTQIEILNESLVKFLMDRDDLHMEQDSMLVDIEDLTRFLGAKEQTIKEQGSSLASMPPILSYANNNGAIGAAAPVSPLAALSVRPHLHRIASLVKNK